MPYISEEQRRVLNNEIDDLVNKIFKFDLDDREGIVNYVISRIVALSLEPDGGWKYKHLQRAHGTLQAAAAEFYRRMIAPYENSAINKNGDLPEYEEFTDFVKSQ